MWFIFKSSFRSSLLSLFGMILVLLLISTVAVAGDPVSDEVFIDSLKDREFRLEYRIQPVTGMTIGYNRLNNFNGSTFNELQDLDLNKFVSNTIVQDPVLEFKHCFNNQTNVTNEEQFNLISDSMNLLENIAEYSITGSRIPETFDELLLVIPEGDEGIFTLGSTYHTSDREEIHNSITNETISYFYNTSFTITAITILDSLPQELNDRIMSSVSDGWILVTNPAFFCEFYNSRASELENDSLPSDFRDLWLERYLSVKYGFVFDFSAIEYSNIDNTVHNISTLSYRMHNSLPDYILFSERDISDFVQLYSTALEDLTFFYLDLTLPVLILAMILIYHSFSLMEYYRNRSMNLLGNHGVSRRFLVIYQLLESSLLYIIAFVMVFVLMIPLEAVIRSSTGLMQFERPLIFRIMTESEITFTFFSGFLFVIAVFLRIITSASSQVEGGNESKFRKITRPFWQRHHLDIFALISGLILAILTRSLVTAYLDDPVLYRPLMEVTALFSVLSPLLLLIGLIMLFNRAFIFALGKPVDYLWEKGGGLVSIALKNLSQMKKSSSAAALIITLAICFIFTYSSVSISIANHQLDTVDYQVGADISAAAVDSTNVTGIFELVESVKNLADVEEVTLALSYMTTFFHHGEIRDGLEVLVVGLLQDAGEVLKIREDFSDSNLKEKIDELPGTNSIIVNTAFKDKIQPFLDEYNVVDLLVSNRTSISLCNVTQRLIGTYRYFPHYYNAISYHDSMDCIIGDFWHFLDLAKDTKPSDGRVIHLQGGGEIRYGGLEYKLFIKLKEGASTTGILSELTSIDGIDGQSVVSGQLLKQEIQDSTEYSIFWMIVNTNVLAGLIVVEFTLFLYLVARLGLDRKHTAIDQALGMSFKQQRIIILLEGTVITCIAVITGILTSLMIHSAIITGMNSSYLSPPVLSMIPVSLLLLVLVLMLLGSLLLTLVMIRKFRDRGAPDLSRVI